MRRRGISKGVVPIVAMIEVCDFYELRILIGYDSKYLAEIFRAFCGYRNIVGAQSRVPLELGSDTIGWVHFLKLVDERENKRGQIVDGLVKYLAELEREVPNTWMTMNERAE